jgi:predicted DNA binding protein
MSVLAEFTVPAEEFVLADTLTSSSGMRIEIKRVAGGESTVTPYFWASNGDFASFEDALHDDEMVREVLTLERDDETTAEGEEDRFYRVTWEMTVPDLVSAVSEAKATVLEAVSEDGGDWEVKVLFPHEEALSAFHDYCVEHDFDVEPQRVYEPKNPQGRAEYGVTEAQQEGLEAAYHAGYFAVPREQTLTEVAETLGISRNALSARLRRGHRNLLANTLVHEEGSEL